jgi:hypothetical protein
MKPYPEIWGACVQEGMAVSTALLSSLQRNHCLWRIRAASGRLGSHMFCTRQTPFVFGISWQTGETIGIKVKRKLSSLLEHRMREQCRVPSEKMGTCKHKNQLEKFSKHTGNISNFYSTLNIPVYLWHIAFMEKYELNFIARIIPSSSM